MAPLLTVHGLSDLGNAGISVFKEFLHGPNTPAYTHLGAVFARLARGGYGSRSLPAGTPLGTPATN